MARKEQECSMNPIHTPPRFKPIVERFGLIFDVANPKPIKVGIGKDLVNAGIDLSEASAFLGFWCRTLQYHECLTQHRERVDLDGNVAGAVSDAEREHAILAYAVAIERANERRAARKEQRKQAKAKAKAKPSTDATAKTDTNANAQRVLKLRPKEVQEVESGQVQSRGAKVKVEVRKRKAIDPSSPWAALSALKAGNQ
jgi:sRNA-binding protein